MYDGSSVTLGVSAQGRGGDREGEVRCTNLSSCLSEECFFFWGGVISPVAEQELSTESVFKYKSIIPVSSNDHSVGLQGS